MQESRDVSLGSFLGWIAVVGGILYLGMGIAYTWKGRGTDGIDGLIFGGLAFVAGCLILHRRNRINKSKETEPGQGEPQ